MGISKTQMVKLFIVLFCICIGLYILLFLSYSNKGDIILSNILLVFSDFVLAGYWIWNSLPLFMDEMEIDDNKLSIIGMIK